MRADRLVSLLLLLQSRGRATARELARRLQVSERTILRDLEALSASGVPVVTTRGAQGGVSLLDGWRTTLTGLTRPELHALAAMGAPGALDDLGLSGPLQTGLVKLAAALPAMQRATADHARQRLLVDPSPWFAEREPVPHLETLREAAWLDREVRLAYRDVEGRRSTRVVQPYGLVVKADRWYLVAGAERGAQVFRGARIDAARLLPGSFTRPAGFDLPSFWRDWCRRFGEKRASFAVTLRLTSAGREDLCAVRPASEHECIRRRAKTVVIDFEREAIALSQLCLLGRGVEVVAPEPLRARLAAISADLAALYVPSTRERRGGR